MIATSCTITKMPTILVPGASLRARAAGAPMGFDRPDSHTHTRPTGRRILRASTKNIQHLPPMCFASVCAALCPRPLPTTSPLGLHIVPRLSSKKLILPLCSTQPNQMAARWTLLGERSKHQEDPDAPAFLLLSGRHFLQLLRWTLVGSFSWSLAFLMGIQVMKNLQKISTGPPWRAPKYEAPKWTTTVGEAPTNRTHFDAPWRFFGDFSRLGKSEPLPTEESKNRQTSAPHVCVHPTAMPQICKRKQHRKPKTPGDADAPTCLHSRQSHPRRTHSTPTTSVKRCRHIEQSDDANRMKPHRQQGGHYATRNTPNGRTTLMPRPGMGSEKRHTNKPNKNQRKPTQTPYAVSIETHRT